MMLGSLAGARIGRNVSNAGLRRGFAGFLVVMGVYVLVTSAPKLLRPAPAQAAHLPGR